MGAAMSDNEIPGSRRAMVMRRGLMAWPEDSAADRLKIAGVADVLAALQGVMTLRLPGRDLVVPYDSDLPAALAWYLAVGDYEAHDLDLAADHVRPGDRVMELGGGIGVTGCALGRASGTAVVIVEPNAALYPAIRRTFAANDVPLVLVEAAAGAGPAGTARLAVAENYWWSRMGEGDGTIAVALVPLEQLIADHRPTVLAVDIEGHEATLVGSSIGPSVRLVLFEIHSPDIGTRATGDVVRWLEGEGFRLIEVRGQSWAMARD